MSTHSQAQLNAVRPRNQSLSKRLSGKILRFTDIFDVGRINKNKCKYEKNYKENIIVPTQVENYSFLTLPSLNFIYKTVVFMTKPYDLMRPSDNVQRQHFNLVVSESLECQAIVEKPQAILPIPSTRI